MDSRDLILDLHRIQVIKFGNFTLKSGLISPIYLDLRVTVSYPFLLKAIAATIWEGVKDLSFDTICGVPYTALPIATCISVENDIPMLMRRKEIKTYGTKKALEGAFTKGQSCLIIEDLITSGSSVLETIAILKQEGLKVQDVAVLIDREQGGKQNLRHHGLKTHSVCTISQILKTLHEENKIDERTFEEVFSFIRENQTEVPSHAS